MAITFHNEDHSFNLKQRKAHRSWLDHWIRQQQFNTGDISYIFTSNQRILSINQEYLDHDHFTDIITFDYREGKDLSADIFISVEEVKLNARRYKVSFYHELRRVMAHGVNHLMGYEDHSEQEKELMRQKEDEALLLWNKLL